MGISQFIKDKAMELGFSACGIAAWWKVPNQLSQ